MSRRVNNRKEKKKRKIANENNVPSDFVKVFQERIPRKIGLTLSFEIISGDLRDLKLFFFGK